MEHTKPRPFPLPLFTHLPRVLVPGSRMAPVRRQGGSMVARASVLCNGLRSDKNVAKP